MRLIDAERFEAYDCKTSACAYEGNEFHAYLDGMQRVLEDLDAAPTIDPESLPIVQQLRAELKQYKELDVTPRQISLLVKFFKERTSADHIALDMKLVADSIQKEKLEKELKNIS